MKKINIYITFIAFATAILLQSCSWFDVGSQSDRNEDEMFETAEGYYTSLTGLYINMGTQKLYGGNLSLLALEPLTQQYTISGDEHFMKQYFEEAFELPTSGCQCITPLSTTIYC